MIVNPRILRGGRHPARPGPPPMSPIWPLAVMVGGLVLAPLLLALGCYFFSLS